MGSSLRVTPPDPLYLFD